MNFVEEPLAAIHQEQEIYCISCHGPSMAHANDENIGATPPDIIIERDQIGTSCRTCHETHDVPPEKVIARFLERTKASPATKPATQQARPVVVCTDCHGTHRIAKM
jgi:hypothetical protein